MAPDHPVEQFINVITTNLADPSFFGNFPKTKNLTNAEFKAIKSLKCNDNIVILPADKGNSIVLLNKTDYIIDCERQLNYASTYIRTLKENITITFNEKIKECLDGCGPNEDLFVNTIELFTLTFPKLQFFTPYPKFISPQDPHEDDRSFLV